MLVVSLYNALYLLLEISVPGSLVSSLYSNSPDLLVVAVAIEPCDGPLAVLEIGADGGTVPVPGSCPDDAASVPWEPSDGADGPAWVCCPGPEDPVKLDLSDDPDKLGPPEPEDDTDTTCFS